MLVPAGLIGVRACACASISLYVEPYAVGETHEKREDPAGRVHDTADYVCG